MKTALKNFLSMTTTDQRGTWFLMLLIVIVQTVRYILPFYSEASRLPNQDELFTLTQWEQSLKKVTESNHAYYPSKSTRQYILPNEKFNPNEYSLADWKNLGFTEKESASILKFKSAIQGFKKPKDLEKLYCMKPEFFADLKPFLIFPEQAAKTQNQAVHNFQTPKSQTLLELNGADSLALLKIRGIGPYWAKRITKYKNQWGGFYQIEQLQQMKGFPDSLFQTIKNKLWVDSTLIKKIPINSISLEQLNKHPVGWYGVGKSIVNYRDQHGPFQSFGDFQKLYALNPEKIEILVHYITFE